MHRAIYFSEHQFLVFVPEGFKDSFDLPHGHCVFVCGALQNPEKMESLLGHAAAFAPALVQGFRRGAETIDGRSVPFMLPHEAPDAALSGVIWLGLGDDDLVAVESLELKDGLRERMTVKARCGERTFTALTYFKRASRPL